MPDTQAAYRRLEPQTELMRAASGMSRTIDRRRPRRLDASGQAEVDRHPEVRLLRRKQQSLKEILKANNRSIASRKGTSLYDEYRKASHAHRNMKRRCTEALLKEVKAKWKKEQPVIDIQRQLKGLPIASEATMEVENYILAERVRAIDTLFTFATGSPEDECQRRAAAINALTMLCRVQEGRGFRRRQCSSDVKLEEGTPSSALQPSTLSDSLKSECEATQCIFCLGDEGLPAFKRLWVFSSRGDLKKHFRRKHLRHHCDGQPIACPHPRCDAILEGKMQLENHADLVHNTPMRWSPGPRV